MSIMLKNQCTREQPYGNYHLHNVLGFLGVTGKWSIYLYIIYFSYIFKSMKG